LLIEEYFSQVKGVVDQYATANFVTSTNLTFDSRPGDQGILSGMIEFVDNSRLHFREYLDAFEDKIEKVMYSYHYQNASRKLILRYDNSAHKPRLQSEEHRHDAAGVRDFTAPRLADVLSEIVAINHWA